METLLNSVVTDLQAGLGPQLDAVYLFGGLATGTFQPDESAVDLLLVTADNTPLTDIHAAFHPIWQAHGRILRHAPLLTTTSDFANHMTLAPVLAGHLKRHGRALYGSAQRLQQLPDATRQQINAAHAHRALTLSPFLFDDTPADATSTAALRRLARHVTHAPVAPDATAVDLFSHIHAQLSDIGTPPPEMPADTAVDGLVSIVRKTPRLTIFVFDTLTPERIRTIDWQALAAAQMPANNRPVVTTWGHLQTFVQHETAIDHAFDRCSIQWGLDPFAGVTVPVVNVIRQAGHRPCGLRLDLLPRAYLAADHPDNALVHDFQNRVLNVHLEHEILCRLGLSERFRPTRPLPDRTAPTPERIAAIFSQLDEWVTFYAQKVQTPAG